MKTKLFLTGLVFFAITALASGQQEAPPVTNNNQTNRAQWGPAFVDANNDGICDNIDNPRTVRPGQGRFYYRGGRGYGNCRGYAYRGRGNGFRGGYGPAQGRGMGRGMGRGQGRFYVDKDNNGVCDYFEGTAPKK